MARKITFNAALMVAGALVPGHAFAAAPPATAVGQATAALIDPLGVTPIADLRFGQFLQPTAAGTLTVSETGAVTTTGGMVGQTGLTQANGGRGAAVFVVGGDANRALNVAIPSQATITSGVASMRVSNFTRNGNNGNSRLDSAGFYYIVVGARLTVAASQPVGHYSGTFTVTVTYQ